MLGWSEEEVLEARLAAGCLNPQSLNVTTQSPDGVVGEAIDVVGEEDAGFEGAERRDELRRAFAHLSNPSVVRCGCAAGARRRLRSHG